MKIQKTNYDKTITNVSSSLNNSIIGSWKKRSISILSILIGFYFVSTLMVVVLDKNDQRLLMAALSVVFVELLIRLRSIWSYKKGSSNIIFSGFIDGFRIGITYAIVLEAFKLGS